MNMKVNNKAFIILYKGYNLPNNSKKINKLYKKSFKIVEKIKILIYYLKLPLIWKIYNIINIIMLKSGLKDKDFYN